MQQVSYGPDSRSTACEEWAECAADPWPAESTWMRRQRQWQRLLLMIAKMSAATMMRLLRAHSMQPVHGQAPLSALLQLTTVCRASCSAMSVSAAMVPGPVSINQQSKQSMLCARQ